MVEVACRELEVGLWEGEGEGEGGGGGGGGGEGGRGGVNSVQVSNSWLTEMDAISA